MTSQNEVKFDLMCRSWDSAIMKNISWIDQINMSMMLNYENRKRDEMFSNSWCLNNAYKDEYGKTYFVQDY